MIFVIAIIIVILGMGVWFKWIGLGTIFGISKGVKKINGENRFYNTEKNFDEWYEENKNALENAMTMHRMTKWTIENNCKGNDELIKKVLKESYNNQKQIDDNKRAMANK